MVLGALVGGVAGYAGGALDDLLMRATDFVLVLPAMYVVLALRAVLPLVLAPRDGVRAAGRRSSPSSARRSSRAACARSSGPSARLDYAAAAPSLGASHARLLVRHLLPAARGFIGVEITLLVPAFIVAEATLSYVGLGFPDPIASWGTMLHDASNVRVFADFPWLLESGAAMFLVVLGAEPDVLQAHGATRRRRISADESRRRVRSHSHAVRRSAIASTPARLSRGARQVGVAPAHRLRRARLERRGGADGRRRSPIASSPRRARPCRAIGC